MFDFFKKKTGPCKFCGENSPQVLKGIFDNLFYHDTCMDKRQEEIREEKERGQKEKERREKIDLIKEALREFEEEKK